MTKQVLSELQKKFVEEIIENGEVEVKEVATNLGVSVNTIYNCYNRMKDLIFQRKKGRIGIYEKDAGVASDFIKRKRTKSKIKDLLAGHVVNKYIKENDIIYLDCGSTSLFIAEQIIEHEIENISVVTTNPYVLLTLKDYKKLRELSVIGGTLNIDTGSFYGNWVTKLMSTIDFRFMKSFIGVNGLWVSKNSWALTLYNSREIEQKKIAMAMSDNCYFVLDDSKIGIGGEKLVTHNDKNNFSMQIIVGVSEEEDSKFTNMPQDIKGSLEIVNF